MKRSSPVQKPPMTPPPAVKRRRCTLSIEKKITMLDSLNAGVRPAQLSRQMNVSESTLRQLLRNAPQLRRYAANCSAESFKSLTYIPRNTLVDQTEFLLHRWHEQHKTTRVFTIAEMCQQARLIYQELQAAQPAAAAADDEGEADVESALLESVERDFKASKAWFNRFRRTYNLDFPTTREALAAAIHRNGQSQPTETATTAAATAANEPTLNPILQGLLQSGAYQPQQVFYATELSLAWRSLPVPTRPSLHHSATTNNDRLSLLLCCNASGDFVVKPLLVHRAQQPFSLRSRPVAELPVFWRARERHTQSQPRVTARHLSNWLDECFRPAVQDYFSILELEPRRAVLILDESMRTLLAVDGVGANGGDGVDGVRLEFVGGRPWNCSVLPLFQCIYQQHLLTHLVEQLAGSKKEAPAEADGQVVLGTTGELWRAWRQLSVGIAVDFIAESVEQMKNDWWNAGWAVLWPEMVRQPREATVALNAKLRQVVALAHRLPGRFFANVTALTLRRHLKITDDDAVTIAAAVTVAAAKPAKKEQPAENDDDNVDNDNVELDDTLADDSSLLSPLFADDDPLALRGLVSQATNNTMQSDDQSSSQVANSYLCRLGELRDVNRALQLAQELIEAVAVLPQPKRQAADRGGDFANSLNELMRPFRQAKDDLLQPSVRDYFQSR